MVVPVASAITTAIRSLVTTILRMRMQPNDRIRSVIIIFEMKPMSFALGRKLPGPGVFGSQFTGLGDSCAPVRHPRGTGLINRTAEVFLTVPLDLPFRLSPVLGVHAHFHVSNHSLLDKSYTRRPRAQARPRSAGRRLRTRRSRPRSGNSC